MKIIDFHVHVFPEDIVRKVIDTLQGFYGAKWQGAGVLPDYLAQMESAGIGTGVIFSAATKPEQVRSINDYIANLVRRYPEKLTGFGTLLPGAGGMEAELERIQELGLKGIKFHPDFQQVPADSADMVKLCRLAAERNLPVLLHAGDRRYDFSRPARIVNLHRLVPELTLVAAHLGGWGEWENAEEYLIGKERDIYLDISSTMNFLPPEKVRQFVRAHGADKILFASDYPAVTPGQTVKDLLELGLTDEENELIFYKNAERILA